MTNLPFHKALGTTRRLILLGVFLAFALLVLRAPTIYAKPRATITVTNANDSGANSLRQAIAGAGDGDTINFDNTYTINLTSGELLIDKNLTIDGTGHTIVINGPGASCVTCFRVFNVNSGVTFNLQNLTVANGNAGSDKGGGIYNLGTVNVTNSTFSGNSANEGGGIFNDGGTVNVTNSTFSSNSATLVGVGTPEGGGIDNYGTLNVTNSTFSGNSAGLYGGGILSSGTATVINSTFSGNNAGYIGGGIHNYYGTVTVINSTFSGNSASLGGGIYNDGTVTAKNSIIANSTGGNCSGTTITDGGGNLVWGDTTCPGINADPKLGALANNGGPTQTMKLGPDSPAIDAGDPTTCANSPVNGLDQRGKPRDDLQCDIGAYEMKMTDGNWAQRTIADGPLTTFGPATAGIGFSSDFPPNPGLTTVAKVTNWTGGTPGNAIGAWWDINPTTATGLNITLELCYTDAERHGLTEGDLRFWRYSGGSWAQVGDAPGLSDGSAVYRCAQISGVTDLSRWTLAGGNPGKPPTVVTLSSFRATTPLFDLGAWLKKFLGR